MEPQALLAHENRHDPETASARDDAPGPFASMLMEVLLEEKLRFCSGRVGTWKVDLHDVLFWGTFCLCGALL